MLLGYWRPVPVCLLRIDEQPYGRYRRPRPWLRAVLVSRHGIAAATAVPGGKGYAWERGEAR